jgi:DNA-binding HxlR family transcriptional regulator
LATRVTSRKTLTSREVRSTRAVELIEVVPAHMRNRKFSCGVDVALAAVGRRWRAVVLERLAEQPTGFAALRRRIPGISEKMLTAALADLRAAGFVQRTELRQRPLEVRYVLTDDGGKMSAALAVLRDWGVAHARQHGLTIG